jgi:hypothetical protein
MQRINYGAVLAGVAGIFLALSGGARANSLLMTNMGASGTPSLISYDRYEWSFSFLNPQVRITGMELVFDGNLTELPHASFHDQDYNDTGVLAGTFVRDLGPYKVYQFDFGTSFLGVQSQSYAAYYFNEGSSFHSDGFPMNPIGIAAVSGTPTISYDPAVYSGVNYNDWAPQNSSTDNNVPLFSILAIPEPSAFSLLAVGLGVVLRQRHRTV